MDRSAGPQPPHHRFLLRDRRSNFTQCFDAVFQANGTRILRTAVQAPRMNATCERLLGTLRREPPNRMLILNEAHLHNQHRPHRSLDSSAPLKPLTRTSRS
jgi:putative transposase